MPSRVWQRLLDLGYHPRVCSAPMIPNPCSIQEKIDRIDEKMGSHFGSGVADEAAIDTRRYELEAAALIDDRPEVENSHLASWQHVIFDAPYNRSSAGPRLRGWLDPDLPQLLGACNAGSESSSTRWSHPRGFWRDRFWVPPHHSSHERTGVRSAETPCDQRPQPELGGGNATAARPVP